MQSAFRPVIRNVGQHFKVELKIRFDGFDASRDSIFIGVSAPTNLPEVNDTVLTWHRIVERNILAVT